MPRRMIRHRVSEREIAEKTVEYHDTVLQFLGGFFILLWQLNNLCKTRIRWEIKFVFFFQGPVSFNKK